jgi:hypothetical protein
MLPIQGSSIIALRLDARSLTKVARVISPGKTDFSRDDSVENHRLMVAAFPQSAAI